MWRPTAVFAATGYDLIKVVEAGVIAADSTDPAKVRDAIDNLENVQGATGTISYKGQTRIPLKTVYLVTDQTVRSNCSTRSCPRGDIPAP